LHGIKIGVLLGEQGNKGAMSQLTGNEKTVFGEEEIKLIERVIKSIYCASDIVVEYQMDEIDQENELTSDWEDD
jgi:hypothetical protein